MPAPAPRPHPLPCFVSVGFVGKRSLAAAPTADAVRDALARELTQLEAMFPGPGCALAGVSSLAEGADALFALEIGRRGWLHRVFLPEPVDRFFNPSDFAQPEESRRLLDGPGVIEVRVASRLHAREQRFSEVGIEVAQACDLLLALCTAEEWEQATAAVDATDSSSPTRRGGTLETITYALRAGRPVRAIILDAPPGQEQLRVEGRGEVSRAACTQKPNAFFHPDLPPAPLGELDYRAELAAISAAADRQSARGKRAVTIGGTVVLTTHVLATATAAGALVFASWQHAWLPPYLKVALLVLGFGTAIWLHYRRRHTQEAWVEGRLIAEICRSAQALVGRHPDDAPYAGGLRHLRDFSLGDELRGFTTALHLLHLRELRRTSRAFLGDAAAEAEALRRFSLRYAQQRLDDQLRYYQSKRHAAHASGHGLEVAFFVFSGLALVGAALGIPLHDVDQLWEKIVIKFLPLALPVAAAAMIAWIGLQDLDRRDHRYAEMIALLQFELPKFHRPVSPAILRRRVLQIERALLQEVIEWHQHTRHQRAG